MAKKKARLVELAQVVDIAEAKPNPMFPDWVSVLIRFTRYKESIYCAECGRKGKTFWTLLCSFQAHTMATIVPKKSGKIHWPFTPVCRAHLLAPEMKEVPVETKKTRAAVR